MHVYMGSVFKGDEKNLIANVISDSIKD